MQVEILPREFTDIVVHSFDDIADRGGAVNDVAGHQSVYDAIVNAEFVGFALRGQVVAENLFFFFGEGVEFLQHAYTRFREERSIPYDAMKLYRTIYDKQHS